MVRYGGIWESNGVFDCRDSWGFNTLNNLLGFRSGISCAWYVWRFWSELLVHASVSDSRPDRTRNKEGPSKLSVLENKFDSIFIASDVGLLEMDCNTK